jgi:O-acetyl-ADP-ribose deacetylase (regulator of RNase III)
MPARWVVHTVGPNRHRGQTDPALLASCFSESLRVSAGLRALSVAFPAVGAGVYGWDVQEVAGLAVGAVLDVAAAGQAGPVELVRFVVVGPAAYETFATAVRHQESRGEMT